MDNTKAVRTKLSRIGNRVKPRSKSGTFQDSAYPTPAERKIIVRGARAIVPKLSLSSMYVNGALELAKKRIKEAKAEKS